MGSIKNPLSKPSLVFGTRATPTSLHRPSGLRRSPWAVWISPVDKGILDQGSSGATTCTGFRGEVGHHRQWRGLVERPDGEAKLGVKAQAGLAGGGVDGALQRAWHNVDLEGWWQGYAKQARAAVIKWGDAQGGWVKYDVLDVSRGGDATSATSTGCIVGKAWVDGHGELAIAICGQENAV